VINNLFNYGLCVLEGIVCVIKMVGECFINTEISILFDVSKEFV
jgi:hypothetical protein